MPTSVRSHAKINLGLFLGPSRPDGFHSLVTVYQTLEIHDIVTVTAVHSEQTTLRLSSNDARVPTDERNTAWKMVELALDDFRTPPQWTSTSTSASPSRAAWARGQPTL